ncbi:amino acid adenylation domain-containing protein [Streptomyces sp. NBC_01142]|uniref:Pls/PosA family non-ribosomal peptide synthetase n=1 Tax=Streptomyces sp. NBC_01142 TaxID=2975865 RepID=UPI0022569E1E|nr:Pls/PosA family non-ribosomal peptide synthetase [Streptomyces sp. NBC_01142]MCX4818598.1 amino acid adenylation domain-containing protein [Streptomyces sp. NBC_01142]
MTVAPESPALLEPLLDETLIPALFTAAGAAPERTLLDILDETARRHPDAPAVHDGSGPLTYHALLAEIEMLRLELAAAGIGVGDRVGIRVPSGTADLYVSILAVLATGAAYVPVDAEDPDERADLVFTEAEVSAVIGAERTIVPCGTPAGVTGRRPGPDDDAWIIFTSGSTGKPKGVAVSHRSAAAFVDAEARIFLAKEPLGPGDRVLAGLSVAFDASCEEMWLAWRHGACLVPAPRSLVRTGLDLGPWLVEQRITVVSTVPTLAALWPAEALDDVRLLIFGGEACPPELAERMAVTGREVWNTYGPTEATVVACAAQLTGEGPVRIGLPLDGWELAVVDARGDVVPMGGTGELVIGGVGLARYLDADKDAEKYAPLPALGWSRAYRSGDLVCAEEEGLLFVGRADEQIKLGGRRIELGEIDAALQALPGVAGAAAAVRTTAGGHQLLVGYVVPIDAGAASAGAGVAGRTGDPCVVPGDVGPAARSLSDDTASGSVAVTGAPGAVVGGASGASCGAVPSGLSGPVPEAGTEVASGADSGPAADGDPVTSAPADGTGSGTGTGPADFAEPFPFPFEELPFDQADALARLRKELPAALVPLLAVVDTLPTRTSGKVDRAALPWPLPTPAGAATGRAGLTAAESWLAEQWTDLLGTPVTSPAADFFGSGGGSLAAAQLVSRIRERYATGSVGDIYQNPTLGALARTLEASSAGGPEAGDMRPVPRRTGIAQMLLMVPLFGVAGLRWAVAAVAVNNVIGLPWAPAVSWWWVALGWLMVVSPPGRIVIAAGGARLLLRGLEPGTYSRGGGVHLRLWTAERLAEMSGATGLAGAWLTYYARALGVRIGEDVDLHTLPPVTGMLRLGKGCAVEPEVDVSGHWLDGDRLHIGAVRIGAGAVVGARSTLFPGARIGKRAEIAPGAGVTGAVPAGERWAGVPAVRKGKANRRLPEGRPPRLRRWTAVYSLTSLVLGLLPALAALPGLLVMGLFLRGGIGTGSAPADSTGTGTGIGLGTGEALTAALLAVPIATVVAVVAYALLTLAGVRALSIGLREGHYPVHGRVAWQAWATERLMDMARVYLFPLYASLFTPVWLRALGMKVGRGVEASTVLALPAMTTVGDGAFLADDTMVASYELGGGRLRIAEARVGKWAFLGNSGMTAAGRSVPKRGLVGVLSSTPKRAKAGSSWLGMPPMKLPRAAEEGDRSRTFDPPRRLKWARAVVEVCRIVPVMCSVALSVLALAAFGLLADRLGIALAVLCGGGLLLAGGVTACAVAIAAKWLLVGRFRAVEHPLWSSFVWRNELADTFVEVLAVPWLVGATTGTPLTNLWLRGLGARIGRGAWCETYWLPEADLVTIGDGASVNRGCVVQTHLFHDRIMRMDNVVLGAGATLGPHGIALPGAVIGDRAAVGPASLVMRGESVPAGTRWLGNPIEAWKP